MGRIIRMRWPEGKRGAFTMSYDDGRMEDFRLASIMRENGVRGTFNVNTGLFWPEDKPDPKTNPLHRRMRRSEWLRFAEEYKDLAEIAVHGVTHPDFSTLSSAEIVREVIDDRAAIESDLGTICRGAAYPYGRTGDTAVNALAACGMAYCRTVRATKDFAVPSDWLRLDPTCHHTASDLYALFDAFLEQIASPKTQAKLFYLWGHAYEFDDNDDWDRIEDFLKKAGGREKIWYATNIEIFDYVKAYEALIWSADGTRVFNPGSRPVYYSMNKYARDSTETVYCVRPGETLEIET